MPRHTAGFTLVESLVATGLVVTIALGSAQLFTVAIIRNLSAREQLAMSLLALTKVNDLAAAAANGTIAISAGDGDSETAVAHGRTYVRHWRISRVPGFSDDAVSIAVRVTPVGGPGDVAVTTIREWRRP